MPLINRRGRVQIEIPDKLMERGERMRLFSQVLLSTVRSSAKILSLVLCTPPVISSVERLSGSHVSPCGNHRVVGEIKCILSRKYLLDVFEKWQILCKGMTYCLGIPWRQIGQSHIPTCMGTRTIFPKLLLFLHLISSSSSLPSQFSAFFANTRIW